MPAQSQSQARVGRVSAPVQNQSEQQMAYRISSCPLVATACHSAVATPPLLRDNSRFRFRLRSRALVQHAAAGATRAAEGNRVVVTGEVPDATAATGGTAAKLTTCNASDFRANPQILPRFAGANSIKVSSGKVLISPFFYRLCWV